MIKPKTYSETIRLRYSAEHYASEVQLSEAGLAAVASYRTQFPFDDCVNYHPYANRKQQRYTIITDRYKPYFGDKVLDVGSRNDLLTQKLGRPCHLVDKNNPNLPPFDWEKERLPYDDGSFDTVVCLDTLEHVNDLHGCFADLLRVSKKYIIISLPNAWRRMFVEMLHGHDRFPQYGIPPEKPIDRHKWIFNTEEAENFVFYQSAPDRANYAVKAVLHHAPKTIWRLKVAYPLIRLLAPRHFKNLFVETNFFVLEKLG